MGRTGAAAPVGALLLLPLAEGADDGDYPADITPPPGTQYPCALTPLPRGLPGIPEAERRYINRTYATILKATQAKLVALKTLEEGGDLEGALARYGAATRALEERLGAEARPRACGPSRTRSWRRWRCREASSRRP